MDNLESLLGIRIMDGVANARITELCGVMKAVDERTDKGALRWFGHIERMEKDGNAKRIYIGGCAGSQLLGKPQKR